MKYIKTYEYVKKDEKERFINYMLSYYGPGTTYYTEFFENKLNRDILQKYVNRFIEKRKKLNMWGGGDSLDREVFRDFLLVVMDIDYNIEFDVYPYLTKKEINEIPLKRDAKKYNL